MSDSDRLTETELMARLGLGRAAPQVCDFCSGLHKHVPAAWIYPATAASIDLGGHLVQIDLGSMDWCACEICATFIEADDYSSLARHMGHAPGAMPSSLQMFRRARIGPAQRL